MALSLIMEIVIDDKKYKELLEAIRFLYGYDFTDYAEPSVKRRIVHFMDNRKIASIDDLGKILLKDETVFEEFVQNLSVTVTEMFRDPSFYIKLREVVTTHLATYPIIKIWIAGCATGQEVYSIAILLREEGLLERAIIYATDINQKSLQTAKNGIYALEEMKNYTHNYLKAGGKAAFSQYYIAKHNSVLFDRSLIQSSVFAAHNLATDQSFNEFQLIICRNVIMYFNQRLQDRVISLFYESLSPFGFLGLGDKESILFSEKKSSFEEISRKEKMYRRFR